MLNGHEQDVGAGGGGDQVLDQARRNRPVAEAASVGVAAVDGPEQVGAVGVVPVAGSG